MVAKKGTKKVFFYSNKEIEEWSNKPESNGWVTSYKKGLGSLANEEYKDIIENPYLLKLTNDKDYKKSLNIWFGNDSELRKQALLE